ncbi:hypothetical protein DFJ58DRAFT_843461 [Suillus subalutaceus]|uniref:uncharacterized protein n=1 Tax=Suillus subalutaceus TaxID=48586 RepID=UPI001B864F7B|nr:uncharacterized protein DFJ58DRAFT_843461 [Suillus subalutaceus]KAG1846378.1 hypothetical protein DFJ58DRAFT_843461 [Suillus subalutaceus]
MRIIKFPDDDRAAAIASEKPIIEGEAPPSEWPHHGARRLFLDGHTDHNGLRRLKPSTATTKVKKGVKAPKHPIPPSEDEPSDDESLEGVSVNDAVGTSALEPLPQVNMRKPNYKMRVEVVPSTLTPFQGCSTSFTTAASFQSRSHAILELRVRLSEVTSTEENPVGEPDSEYEEAGRGKKRKLKSANTIAGEESWARRSTIPINSGSSTDGPPSPEHINAGKAMRLRDGPSDESKKRVHFILNFIDSKHVKPRPVTKGSRVVMNRGLRMVYGNSDSESDVDNSVKANSATTTGVIPEATGSANIQSDPLEEKSAQTKDEVVGDKEELPPNRPIECSGPQYSRPAASSTSVHMITSPMMPLVTAHCATLSMTLHATLSVTLEMIMTLHGAPRDLVRDPRDDHDPPRDLSVTLEMIMSLSVTLEMVVSLPVTLEMVVNLMKMLEVLFATLHRNHHEAVRDPRDGLRNPWDVDPRYPYTRGYSMNLRVASTVGTLHPRDAFYHRNPRYGPPQDPYGSGDIRMESDLNTRDSSPVSDFHGNYGPSERERAYPTRYGPGGDLGYTHEGGYRSRHNDLDERGQSLSPYHSRRVGGGSYREEGYPQGPGRRFQDSRWDEGAHLDYDAIPRAFRRDLPNPPRPPPAT